jgi:hypothetical protein
VPPAVASPPVAPEQAAYAPIVSAPADDVSGDIPAAVPWQRVTLAPGIELHYIPGDDARLNELVSRIIQAARPLPEPPPENGEQAHNERTP